MKINQIIKIIWNFVNSNLFIYTLAILFIIILAQMCENNRNLKNELSIYKQNQYALTDTIKNEELKNGALQSSINGFISSEKELKDLNKTLYNDLKIQKGKVISLSHVILILKQDSTELSNYLVNSNNSKPIKENDSTFILPWYLSYKYDSSNYDIFNGLTKIRFKKIDNSIINESTQIINRETQIELVWGQKMEKNKLRVFVNSSYPGFKTKSLEGVLLSIPKRQHWFNGFCISVGITASYNFINKTPIMIIGPHIGYNIYNW